MKAYQVTARSGGWVAGKPARPGDILMLSDNQADYELKRGLIEPVGPSKEAEQEAAKPRRRRR